MPATVPGSTPASVLAAALTGGSGAPSQALFSTSDFPDLPSLITEVVWMPTNATFQGNWQIVGTIQSQGWATGNITAVTGAYTAQPTDAIILASASVAPYTITLPDATQQGFFFGQRYTIKKTDGSANTVTVAGTSGQLIDGASSVGLTSTNGYISVAWDGSNWWIWGSATSGSSPTGAAGGDLAGTYPNPTVNKINGTSFSLPVSIANGGTGSATQNFTGLLTPTTKTGNYTAVPGDMVLCDTTSTAFTVTMPNAPADKSLIGVKIYKQPGTNAITVQRSGSDTFDDTTGTSKTLSLLFQSFIFQYNSGLATWVTQSGNLALAQLDSRYVKGTAPATPVSFSPSNPTGTTSNNSSVMMGTGGTCAYTPAGTGHVLVSVNATVWLTTASNNALIGCRYGTGTAPTGVLAFTATNASPCVFTATGSAYALNTQVVITGAVPTGFTAGNTYYVVSPSGTSFSLATTPSGTPINSSSTGSGNVQSLATGTSFGTGSADVLVRPQATSAGQPFSAQQMVTLTPSTAYWFDFAVESPGSANTCSLQNVVVTIIEQPE